MSDLRLRLEPVVGAEIVHHASPVGLITSRANTVSCRNRDGQMDTFRFEQSGWKKFALPSRLARRLLRLDKLVVVAVESAGEWSSLIVIRDGQCFHVDVATARITPTLALRQSRNPLHQSICRSGAGWYYQGEYGGNPDRRPVPVYRSTDQGRSWQTIYEFPAGKARHIHGCSWDPFENKVWVCTGDFDKENHLLVADEDFEELEWLGDASQPWRTCQPFFTEEAVFWGMDSQLETSYICRLDRATRRMEKLHALPGPVWYSKVLEDGWFVVASAVERGPGVHDDHGHIFVSRDGETWHDVFRARKDAWKMPHFKNGVINFADGAQTSDEFYFSAEALKGIDGRVYRAQLVQA